MKRFILLFIFAVSLLFTLGVAPRVSAIEVFAPCNKTAATPGTVCRDVASQRNSKTNPVTGLIKVVLNILSLIGGVAVIILIIVNSLRLIASGGDSNGIKSARSGLIYALVGIAIIASAQTIVIFVLDKIN